MTYVTSKRKQVGQLKSQLVRTNEEEYESSGSMEQPSATSRLGQTMSLQPTIGKNKSQSQLKKKQLLTTEQASNRKHHKGSKKLHSISPKKKMKLPLHQMTDHKRASRN